MDLLVLLVLLAQQAHQVREVKLDLRVKLETEEMMDNLDLQVIIVCSIELHY